MKKEQLTELLYQMLETEKGGEKIYETALRCTTNEKLREEWERYLEETRKHSAVLLNVFATFELDPQAEPPGRMVVREKAMALVELMNKAMADGDPAAAQIVAAECVVDAETKDHMNWGLLGLAAGKLKGPEAKAIEDAHAEVEDEEDEHLYHSTGWLRELWLESMGLPAVIPPPEERKHVQTAIGAARAKQARGSMRPSGHKGDRSGHRPSAR